MEEAVEFNEEIKLQIKNFEEAAEISDDPYGIASAMQDLLRKNNRDGVNAYFWAVSIKRGKGIRMMDLVAKSPKGNPTIKPAAIFANNIVQELEDIILVSNHIDGTTLPTEWDKNITKKLIQIAELLDMKILEHLIINEDTYYSFKASGLLKQIMKS